MSVVAVFSLTFPLGGVLPDLATADELEDYLQTTVDADLAAMVLAQASAAVRTHLRQDVSLVTDDEITLLGGGTSIALPQFPVSALAVELDAVEFTAWRVEDANLLVRTDGAAWPTTVDVVYTHGWDPVPEDVKRKVLELAGQLVSNPTALRTKSESIDDYTYTDTALTAEEQAVLDSADLEPYRAHVKSVVVTLTGDA